MPSSGETWKQFKILHPLGRGGMGEVFLAEDASLDRKVALKFLPESLQEDENARSRFLLEAKSAAALDHPYICKIYEIGEVEGKAFIAMEYVEGATLQEKLTRGPLGLPEILQIGAEVAEAVEAAHKKSLVHRDLKSPNIKVTPDGHIKVMDFGLAKHLSMEPGFKSKVETLSGRLTEHGATPGTVFYMSPEQVKGEAIDGRSDIFSIGVLLYEMATGKLPFQGATSGLTYDAILNRGPVPPRQVNPDLPAELEQIIVKALEKDRENRYQSAKELLIDLRRLKRDTDSGADVPIHVEGRERPKRRAWAIPACVALLLALAGVALFFTFPRGGGEAIDSLAVLPFENTRNDPQVDYLSDGIAESLIDRLSQLPQLQVMARSTAFRYRGAEAQSAGRDLGVGAVLTGRVVQQGDKLSVHAELVDVESGSQLWGQQYNRELADVFDVQNEIAREILQALRLQLSGEEQKQLVRQATASSEAYQSYLRGRFFWAKRTNEDIKRAITFFQEARDQDPDYALAHSGLADCYVLLGAQFYGVDEDFPPGETVAKARSAALEALRLDPSLAEAQATLAYIKFLSDWDWEGAERDFEKAIALNPDYAIAHMWYSLYLAAMGRIEEAVQEQRRALELEPVSPLQNRHMGLAYFQARRYTEAMDYLEKTLELEASFSRAREWLAVVCWSNGMEDRAVSEADAYDQRMGTFFRLLKERRQAEAVDLLDSLPNHNHLTIVVWYYALAADEERFFSELEQLFQDRHPQLSSTLAFPILDPFRSDPRFTDLRRRMGLEP